MRIMMRAGLVLLAAIGTVLVGCAPAGSAGPTRLDDREAVEATMQRYVRGLDHLDRELYAGSFAADAVLDIDGDVRTGRDAMRAVIDNEIGFRKAQQERGETPRVLFHTEANVHLAFPEADRAERSAYWVTWVRQGKDPEGLSALGVGTSVDELRRVDGQWLITHRRISLQP